MHTFSQTPIDACKSYVTHLVIELSNVVSYVQRVTCKAKSIHVLYRSFGFIHAHTLSYVGVGLCEKNVYVRVLKWEYAQMY